MAKENDIRTALDNAKLSTTLSTFGWIIALVLLVVTIVLGNIRGGDVFALAVVPFSLALLFGVGSMIYGMLARAAAVEEEEKLLLAKRVNTGALDVEEDVRFTSGRSFANYCKYTPYVLSIISALLVGALLWNAWRAWSAREVAVKAMTGNPVHTALVAAVIMLISVFAGAFFVGQSRAPHFRWLRPIGAWLIAGFAVMACGAITAICYNSNFVTVDSTVAKIIFWILALLGVEFITNFVIEFYRPRTIKETRPIFESRILALFTEPGGVMRNIAAALDYQFGFKVSGTWLYSFVERSIFPIILVWALIFWAFTTVHEIGPDQVGVRECLGKVIDKKPVSHGIYFTLPAPFGKMKTFSCTELKQIVIGEENGKATETVQEVEDDGHGHAKPNKQEKKSTHSRVVLWTEPHGSDDDSFIVAVPNSTADNDNVSISFIRLAIPIQYRILPEGIMKFAYDNVTPVKMLKRIGEQVATEYLASSSMDQVMSRGRLAAQNFMLKKVQDLVKKHDLGIEVVSLTILDAHPPVGGEKGVASSYQNVIGALEQKETEILNAQAYAAKSLPESESASMELVAAAKSYEHTVKTVAQAEAERFTAQLKAYLAMPQMFRLKSYLDILEKDAKNSRKYIVSPKLSEEVYQFNFEQKERLDLVDTDITKLTNK